MAWFFYLFLPSFWGGYPELLKLLPWTQKRILTQLKLKNIRDIYIESHLYYRYLQMLFFTKRIFNLKRDYFSKHIFWILYYISHPLVLPWTWDFNYKKIDISVTLNFLYSPPFNLCKYFFLLSLNSFLLSVHCLLAILDLLSLGGPHK